MGFDIERFVDLNKDDHKCLICAICTDVVQNAVYTECEHMFCGDCLREWIAKSEFCRCPICNEVIDAEHLNPIPRIARNLLNDLRIKCDFEKKGCDAIVKLEDLMQHVKQCKFRNHLTMRGEWKALHLKRMKFNSSQIKML
ncbi:hypothetical protein B4U79_18353 [Dinothrombium tinctorium]|uniref:RING-type domain-containing protein n=1 Tax=Dinothrombium tinctorium TaxID=1965070 RepID=A0A3S3RTY1_9ACAR|nr:hypothetical protein B4U79_18353 [Dinothrombium tinctorium]